MSPLRENIVNDLKCSVKDGKIDFENPPMFRTDISHSHKHEPPKYVEVDQTGGVRFWENDNYKHIY